MNKSAIYEGMGYYPHHLQAKVHDSSARFRVVAAGARGGKSMLAGAEIVSALLAPKQHVWCVATQYTLAEKEFDWAVSFLDKLEIGGKRALSLARISNSQRGSKSLLFPWGSRLETRSCEKPQTLLGVELDLLILCEASQIPKSIWERYLRLRISSRQGKMLATSTPNADGGLFFEMFNRAEKDQDWARWQFESRDNPTFPRGEWETMKEEMDAKVFDEQARGLFVSRRGFVFSLSPQNYTAQDVPVEWPFFVGVHYKPNNPVVAVFVSVRPEPRRYIVYDEIHLEGKNVLDICGEIKQRIAGRPKFLGVCCDFWDPAIQQELKTVGFSVGVNRKEKDIGRAIAAQKRVQGLQNALKIRADGSTRLIFHTRAANTIRDFTKVKWPDRREEEQEKPEQDAPLGKYMFGPSAVSYVIALLETSSGVDFYRMAG